MKSLPFMTFILVTLVLASLGARGDQSPTETSPTEPPVLYNAPKSPKGTPVTPKPSMAVPQFLDSQARVGQTLFYEHCAECHGASGQGNWAPAILTQDGNVQWLPIYYVYTYITDHMPAGDAHALRQDEYVNIMAFVLKSQGHPAGRTALSDKSLRDSGALVGLEQPKP